MSSLREWGVHRDKDGFTWEDYHGPLDPCEPSAVRPKKIVLESRPDFNAAHERIRNQAAKMCARAYTKELQRKVEKLANDCYEYIRISSQDHALNKTTFQNKIKKVENKMFNLINSYDR